MNPGAVLIRADASLAIGTGHVMRSLAVAEAWQDAGGVASFAVAELPEGLLPRVSAEGASLRRVHAAPGSVEDARETVAECGILEALCNIKKEVSSQLPCFFLLCLKFLMAYWFLLCGCGWCAGRGCCCLARSEGCS